jgi:hypothetical protein
MLDRRHFLIGAGTLLTASFVNRARAFSRRSGKPLVLWPARKPEETLYVYRQEIWSDYGGEWRVSLGPDQPFAPPPPTWREHLSALGHPLETDDEIQRACREHDLPPEQLDVRLNGFGWEDSWDNFTGPQAKAHHLLKDLDLVTEIRRLGRLARSPSSSSGGLRAIPTHGLNCAMT